MRKEDARFDSFKQASGELEAGGEASARPLAGRAFRLGAAALFLCAAQAPPDDRWHLVARDSMAAGYIDPATLERDGDMRTIQTRMSFAAVERDGTANALIVYRFDCAARTYAWLRITALRADGSSIRNVEITQEELAPRPARAGSNIGDMLDAVCSL
jgi:hypothetical protein